MEYTPEYWQEMADEIMDCFDFDKVHRCMVALDWHWSICNGVPEKHELRKRAREMIRGCIAGRGGATGGFEVYIDRTEGVLELKFVVESWDAHKEDAQ